jgi:hypothetical protein
METPTITDADLLLELERNVFAGAWRDYFKIKRQVRVAAEVGFSTHFTQVARALIAEFNITGPSIQLAD